MSSERNISRRDFVKICGAVGVTASVPYLATMAEAKTGPGRYAQTRFKNGHNGYHYHCQRFQTTGSGRTAGGLD